MKNECYIKTFFFITEKLKTFDNIVIINRLN